MFKKCILFVLTNSADTFEMPQFTGCISSESSLFAIMLIKQFTDGLKYLMATEMSSIILL